MTKAELILLLQTAAKRKTWDEAEDFNPCDFSGGNFDDAYFGGTEDGETHLARMVLEFLETEKE